MGDVRGPRPCRCRCPASPRAASRLVVCVCVFLTGGGGVCVAVIGWPDGAAAREAVQEQQLGGVREAHRRGMYVASWLHR